MTPSKTRHLLIDGDLYAYRLAAANQSRNPETGLVESNPAKAREDLQRFVDWLDNRFGTPKKTAVFSGSHNFRKALYHPYKSNRDPSKRPTLLDFTRKVLGEMSDAIVQVDGLEADDLLGYYMTEPQNTEDRILVSYDKDMRTLPGITIYDTLKNAVYETSVASAELAFLTQVLTGDTTDGYPGVPGVGPKTVEKLLPDILELASQQERWQAILAVFKDYHLNEDYALRMARMARILRFDDIDLDVAAVRLFDGNEGQWVALEELIAQPKAA